MKPSIPPRGRAGPPLTHPGPRPLRRFVAAGLPTLFIAALGLAVAAPPTSAAGTAIYAYAKGGASSPTSCPQTTTTSQQCTLTEALSLATPGSTVALATPGAAGHYVGNWTVGTKGTSAAAPLTIGSATGVSGPVLDGNHGKSAGCPTATCKGPILVIGPGVFVHLNGITFEYAHNGALRATGGAIENVNGGTVSVSDCTFYDNVATDGGAIDNADACPNCLFNSPSGTGTFSVVGSKFIENTSAANANPNDGGAIDNADNGGHGTLTVVGSTFVRNTTAVGPSSDGGAIDNADNGGTGPLPCPALPSRATTQPGEVP